MEVKKYVKSRRGGGQADDKGCRTECALLQTGRRSLVLVNLLGDMIQSV